MVFYTATYTDPKDRAFGLSLGAERYLIKPLEPDCLMDLLKEILDRNGSAPNGTLPCIEDDTCYLKSHNEALFRKLETKMAQLERTNELLQQEIEERRQAEVRLQRLYAAIENAAECVIISSVYGTVEYVNPAFERTTGFLRGEMVGWMPGSGKNAGAMDHFLQTLWNTCEGVRGGRGDLPFHRADGEHFEFETTVSPILDPSGQTSGYVTILRDMTGQRKLEEQLRQAQKMEAIGTLAGGIAHDFNNILSIILGYVDLLFTESPEGTETWQNLHDVLIACDRARNLVRQILTFSRKAERLLVPTDLVLLLKEDVRLLRAALPSTIEISARFEKQVEAKITGDPVQIHQMVLNVATNAAHAMGDRGGLLALKLEGVEVGEKELPGNPDLMPGKYWLLSISDTGIGMDAETAARIFEPFFTTKTPGEGTGLGLSVVHGIVQSHGGAINVYSEPGNGTTFHIYLPVVQPEHGAEGEADATPLPGGSERILFIDDECNLADIGGRMLKRFGYQVTTASSSVTALKLYQANPYAFDLVITDQTMPFLTGSDLTQEMLRARPELPVILCTGFGISASEEMEMHPGVKEVLMKPLTMKKLIRTVRTVLDAR